MIQDNKRCALYISKDAIISNFLTISNGRCAIAVVKANAYGVGIKNIYNILKEVCKWWAVATIKEAKELKDCGCNGNIIVLGWQEKELWQWAIENNIILTIESYVIANMLNKLAKSQDKNIRIILAFDTGMSRYGIPLNKKNENNIMWTIQKMMQYSNLECVGIMSHYASDTMDNPQFSQEQKRLITSFYYKCKALNKNIWLTMDNSINAILSHTNGIARIGIGLYGYANNNNLIESLKLVASVVSIRTVEKGENIGYDCQYTSPQKTQIATISIGYADGFNRKMFGKGCVLINGHRCKIVGKVSMDMTMVDIGGIDNVELGQEVVILGKQNQESITMQELCSIQNCSPYEVICALGIRVERIIK